MHHVTVVLDLHQLGHAYGARLTHPSDVVATEVDEHNVLGALLLVGEQVGTQAHVLGEVHAARPGTSQWTGEDLVPFHAHERLRRTTHERHIGGAHVEHVRRGVHRTQHAIEVESIALVRCGEPLREDHLEDVACLDVLFRDGDL